MINDALLIVLTENSWLYKGLAALLPEMVCVQIGFDSRNLPPEILGGGQTIIAVDSRIVLRGKWLTLNLIQSHNPDATVIWLTREETGRVFPLRNQGNRLLSQRHNIASLRSAFVHASRRDEAYLQRGVEFAGVVKLTQTERRMLPLLVSGASMSVISRLTGVQVKTLYSHRLNILAKTGFRQLAFLQLVHERNKGLPGIPGLEHTDEQAQHKGKSRCTVKHLS